MSQEISEAKSELEAAQSALEAALRSWDESVSELWRTSLALTQAQKRVTRAYELLRDAFGGNEPIKRWMRRFSAWFVTAGAWPQTFLASAQQLITFHRVQLAEPTGGRLFW